MRHQNRLSKLGRPTAHRKQMLRSLSISLIENHRLVTTVTRAKALRKFFEPLVTRAKEDNMHNRRTVGSVLNHNPSINALFNVVAPASKDRQGGYTRVIKLGQRVGDGAELAVIELVDFNDVKPEGTKSSSKKKTRRGGKQGKKQSISYETTLDSAEATES